MKITNEDSLKEVFMREEMKRLDNILEKIDISKTSYLNDDDCIFSLFLSHYEFSFYDCCDVFRRCYLVSKSGFISKKTEIYCLRCIKRILQHIYLERNIILSICRNHNLPKADVDYLNEFQPLEFAKYIETVMDKNKDKLNSDSDKQVSSKYCCILF